MQKLRVAFLDFWPDFQQDENIFLPILKKYFDVEVTSNNPDVIIHSIFGGMKETPNYKCKKILFLGENYRPNQFKTDYSISFDPQSDTNYRLPLWQYFLILRPELQDKLFGERTIPEKFDRFCSFVVSNPNNFMRNGFFHKMNLQSFGKVHSYGRYLSNSTELQEASKGKYWRDAKYEFMLKFKHQFSIAFENNSYPYYCTEKIMDAFLGSSIPLYWGDPKINEDWNKEAFINVGKIGVDETINLLRQMQVDQSLEYKMRKAPIFTNEQKQRHLENIKNFEYWLINTIKK